MGEENPETNHTNDISSIKIVSNKIKINWG